jgi:amino acid efflux transporter
MEPTSSGLVRHITLPQAIALYLGAVLGAGVLILPGVAASMAGPASLLAWVFDGLLSVPLALTFAFLAARFPDAGGVATYTSRAFGSTWGTVVGWFYFFAAATGQIIVPLTGSYYVTTALGWGRLATFLVAGLILALAVAANLGGLRLSGRLQLALSGGVALVLLTTAIVALPHAKVQLLTPLFPHGTLAVGHVIVFLFFAFFGWEAVAQLSAEFRNPARDILWSTLWSVIIVTILYLGTACAVVVTGTYGTAAEDRVAVALVLATSLGGNAQMIAAGIAVIISLSTANAFVAATSRLGYALGRDGAFPAWLGRLNRRRIPQAAVLAVGGFALLGLLLTYLAGSDAEQLLAVPNSLGLATYLIGMAAGVRLLRGWGRALAVSALLMSLAAFPFAGASVILPLALAVAAILYRQVPRRNVKYMGLPVRLVATLKLWLHPPKLDSMRADSGEDITSGAEGHVYNIADERV